MDIAYDLLINYSLLVDFDPKQFFCESSCKSWLLDQLLDQHLSDQLKANSKVLKNDKCIKDRNIIC